MRSFILFAVALVLAACEPTPEQPRTTSSPLAPTASSAPPVPTASSAPRRDTPEGAWEGRYDAKKGTVTLPPKVKDKQIDADTGKAWTGPGTIELTVKPEGDVRGVGRGSLGKWTISGRVEKGLLRAALWPEDPRAPDAMTGVLTGTFEDDAIHAELRVAGPDGTVVRESAVELERK